MEFAKGLLQAYDKKWSYVNSFTVQIQVGPLTKTLIPSTANLELEDINLNIISIDTPQFTNQNIEVYVGDQWKIHNGRDELYRYSITFRDESQMSLYKQFVKMYQLQKTAYFDQVKMDITLFKDADYYNETNKVVMNMSESMIDSVSQVQFSNNTENQIAEFTVQFKCTTPEVGV
jgi:hypothetical protein